MGETARQSHQPQVQPPQQTVERPSEGLQSHEEQPQTPSNPLDPPNTPDISMQEQSHHPTTELEFPLDLMSASGQVQAEVHIEHVFEQPRSASHLQMHDTSSSSLPRKPLLPPVESARSVPPYELSVWLHSCTVCHTTGNLEPDSNVEASNEARCPSRHGDAAVHCSDGPAKGAASDNSLTFRGR